MWKALKLAENMLESIDGKARETLGNTNEEEGLAPTTASVKSERYPSPKVVPGEVETFEGAAFEKIDVDEEIRELKLKVQKLLEEKMAISTKFAMSLEEKENDFTEVIKKLKAKDDIIIKLQVEKENIVAELNETKNRLQEEVSLLKQKCLEFDQENQKMGHELINFKLLAQQQKDEIRREMEDLEKESMQQQEKMDGKIEELRRMQESLELRDTQLQKKDVETDQYKNRVQQIIKEKNSKIELLEKKLDNPSLSDTSPDDSEKGEDVPDPQFEIETLKREVKNVTSKWELEHSIRESENATNGMKIRNLEKSVTHKEEELIRCQDIVRTLKAGLKSSSSKQEEEVSQLSEAVRKKDEEIFALQREIAKLKNESELEQKLRVVTEHLIKNQSMMETVESEKLALQLKLEKERNKVKELTLSTQMRNEGEEHHRTPNMGKFRQRPKDTIIQIPMKMVSSAEKDKRFFSIGNMSWFNKVVAVVDRYCISVNTHIRENVNVRRFVFFYILFIHFWILLLLF